MIDLTPVVQAFITLATTIITVVVVPYIRSKTSAEQRSQMQGWARIGVAAAEQIYSGSGRGSEKKQYVIDFLQSKGYTVDSSTVAALIESEVNSLWQDVNITKEMENLP